MFDPTPITTVQVDTKVYSGLNEITAQLNASLNKESIIAIEIYPCIDLEMVSTIVSSLAPSLIIEAKDGFKSPSEIRSLLHRDVTDDRILGRRTLYRFEDFIDKNRMKNIRDKSNMTKGRRVVWGTGASLLVEADTVIYLDIARWETQLRYRTNRYANWMADNSDEDPSRKIKRAYFTEWIMADRLKRQLDFSFDWYIDANDTLLPKMVEAPALREAYRQIAQQPFRLKPFFDPGVWGGHWMQETLGVGQEQKNLAWSFDGVPEENSLLINLGDGVIETPAINLVYAEPVALLGERVYGRFGADFPIRFDLLDTVGGQNLSLQVHPQTEYIQTRFGMPYTQDESYYILHAEQGTYVYAGLKKDINKDDMIHDLYDAEQGNSSFDADKYVNRVPVETHDHISYPGGTIHCSGKDMVVLEISSTPNRFTFKLWDWDRVDLDGLPRPINLGHGIANVDWSRDTDYVYSELLNPLEVLHEDETSYVERTGLHEREFIETQRYWFKDKILHGDKGSVRMLNLVEGKAAVIESVDGSFAPFTVHYAETFIVPASIRTFTIRAIENDGKDYYATIEASVR